MPNPLENVAEELDKARAWIEQARQVLQAASQDAPEIQRAVARLERMEAEPTRIEGTIMVRVGLR